MVFQTNSREVEATTLPVARVALVMVSDELS